MLKSGACLVGGTVLLLVAGMGIFHSQEKSQLRRQTDELRSSASLSLIKRDIPEAEKLIHQALSKCDKESLTFGVLVEELGTIYLARKDQKNAASRFEQAELHYRSLNNSTIKRAATEAAIRCNLQRIRITKEMNLAIPMIKRSVQDLIVLSRANRATSAAQLSFYAIEYQQILNAIIADESLSDTYGKAQIHSDQLELERIKTASLAAPNDLIRGISKIHAGTISKSVATIRDGADELYELASRNRNKHAESATTFTAVLEGCRGYNALGLHNECFQLALIGLEVLPLVRFKNESEKLANKLLLCQWLTGGSDASSAFSYLSTIWAEEKLLCEKQKCSSADLRKLLELSNKVFASDTKMRLPKGFNDNAIPVCLECSRLQIPNWQSILLRCLAQYDDELELRLNALSLTVKAVENKDKFLWSTMLFDEIVNLKPSAPIHAKALGDAVTTAALHLDQSMPSYPTKLRRLQRATELFHFDTSWIKQFRNDFFQSISKQSSTQCSTNQREFLARAYCEEALNESERSNLNWARWQSFRDKIFTLCGTSSNIEPWRAHVYLRLFTSSWTYYNPSRASEIDEAGLRALRSGQQDVKNTTMQARILVAYGQYLRLCGRTLLAGKYYREAIKILQKLHLESDQLYAEAVHGLK